VLLPLTLLACGDLKPTGEAPAQDPALLARPAPAADCGGPAGPVTVGGVVRDREGAPVVGARVGRVIGRRVVEPMTRTDARGAYSLTLDGPTWFTVADYPTQPGEACARRPPPASPDESSGYDQDFTTPALCPDVTVRVVGPGGAPVADAHVLALARGAYPGGRRWQSLEISAGPTGDDGRAPMTWPCGELALSPRAAGLVSAAAPASPACERFEWPAPPLDAVCVNARPGEPLEVTLETAPGAPFTGRLLDPDGAPVVGARIEARLMRDDDSYASGIAARATSDAEGRFAASIPVDLRDRAGQPVFRVYAEGYFELYEHLGAGSEVMVGLQRFMETAGEPLPTTFQPPSKAEGGGLRWDLAMRPSREVMVSCEGISGAACGSLSLRCEVLGASPPVWGDCPSPDEDAADRVCACPAGGPLVARGGGVSVRVEPDQERAWLDFRGLPAVRGQIEGVRPCYLVLEHRRPLLRAILGEPLSARYLDCPDDGLFAFEGVPPGDYRLRARAARRTGGAEAETNVKVRDGDVHVGALHLR